MTDVSARCDTRSDEELLGPCGPDVLDPVDAAVLARAEVAKPAGLSGAALSRALPALVALGAVRQLPGRTLAPGDALGDNPSGLAEHAAALVTCSHEREQSKVAARGARRAPRRAVRLLQPVRRRAARRPG